MHIHLLINSHIYAHVSVCPLDKMLLAQWNNKVTHNPLPGFERAGLKHISPRHLSGVFFVYIGKKKSPNKTTTKHKTHTKKNGDILYRQWFKLHPCSQSLHRNEFELLRDQIVLSPILATKSSREEYGRLGVMPFTSVTQN